ncbi:MAG: sugar-binding domain-containing protein [Erysipelotrichaceae bacterium]|nr:sugar-binding domain-containing protein [Erysipelotrichaceae bacterium]
MNVLTPLKDDTMSLSEVTSMLRGAAPEMVETLASRYRILRLVNYLQPIGRRNLSGKLGLTERVARKEAFVLKEQGLIDFSLEGMHLTLKGYEIYELLKRFFKDLLGLIELEQQLAERLSIRKVVLAPASEEDPQNMRQKELGKAGAEYLRKLIKPNSVIGITGGTTVQSVIDSFKQEKEPLKDVMIVPARGGVGNRAEYQANTLVERFANRLGCKYRLLFTPDLLSKDTISSLKNEPDIKALLTLIDQCDILLFGVGDALTMAERRGLNEVEVGIIKDRGAVAEAFGHYFNREGEIVHELSTIGISLKQFKEIRHPIAVAGELSKADAIVAISKIHPGLILVTDESVAKYLLNTLSY